MPSTSFAMDGRNRSILGSVKIFSRDDLCKLNFSQDVLVGDLALLEPGEIIPCDGVLVAGHNIRCDESGATGESDAIKKVTPDEALEYWKVDQGTRKDPFIISSSKVLDGVGQYIVIAVGQKSFNGRIMMSKPPANADPECI